MLSVFLVLPLVVTRLDQAEIAVWYLFASASMLATLLDTGIVGTFQRFIAYGMGGAESIAECTSNSGVKEIVRSDREPNWRLIERTYSTIRVLNGWMIWIVLFLLVTVGSWALFRPISSTSNPLQSWVAWGLFIISQGFIFTTRPHMAVLNGINEVALNARCSSLFNLTNIGLSCVVLLLGGGLSGLSAASLVIAIGMVSFYRRLLKSVAKGRFAQVPPDFDPEIVRTAWSPCWKSAVVVLSSSGMMQLSGFVYAQIGDVASLASYLFGIKLFNILQAFTSAPFYARVPEFVRLYASHDIKLLRERCGQAMALSLWLFAAGVLTIGLIGPFGLHLIGAKVELLPRHLLMLLGFAWIYDRANSLHGQIIMWTNEVYGYWVVPIFGACFLSLQFLFGSRFGVEGMVWAYVSSYVLIYFGWIHVKAASVLKTGLAAFTFRHAALPVLILFIASVVTNLRFCDL
ncbi:hypothetical protein Ga0100231_009195 [Opitutaceae bacterium TAV4]|nr:hypothetical protein Ga0100231_008940 [Opitutaceae bacterium TAV4]RRJ94497.1 hypothetical protein Ga0100231_009195 [Opitutaceae bacterium TAV4]RRJ98558.1 hypothetical protein Ga0100230_009285 [Opitutaceae bacterium TAV3]